MQLYSKERGISQAIEGHAGAFAELKLDGATSTSKLFTFAVRTAVGAKVEQHLRSLPSAIFDMAEWHPNHGH